MEEIKEKWLDISNRKPNYLSDFDYDLVRENYLNIRKLLLKCIVNEHFSNNKIDLIFERIESYHILIRRFVDDKLMIMIWTDDLTTIEEMIEDCVDLELYEGAGNLKKLLDKLNAQ